MINQQEVPMYLQQVLPEFDNEPDIKKRCNPYIAMHTLLDYTAKKIKEHNYTAVKKCFEVADKLYLKGNNVVKNAVENVYVYSFTTILQIDVVERKKLLAIVPIGLYTLYINQLHHSGC